MRRRLLFGIALLLILALLAGVGVLLWLRSEGLRDALEAQASAALGVPVRIERARATFFPGLGIELVTVTAGDPPRARVDRVSIATELRVLWNRRVEAADVELIGGYLESAWLTALTAAASPSGLSSAATTDGTPLTIVSIRSIRLRDVVLTSSARQIPIDLTASFDHDRLTLTDVVAKVGDTTLHIAGELSSITRREGHVDVRADVLPVTAVIAVVNDMASGGPVESAASTPSAPFRLTASISAPVAVLGSRRAEMFAARLEATPEGIVLDPVTFGLDEGRFEMRVGFDAFDAVALVEAKGRVSGLDVARLQAATSARKGALTGALEARFDLRAPPQAELFAMFDQARGSIDLGVRNGRMPGIQVVRQAVLRLANRAGPPPRMDATDAFSRLDASLSLQSGAARITRLTMAAADFDLEGQGALSPHDWRLALDATVTLSEALSQQAGRDLYRYAHDGRRIVLPVVLGGTLFEPTATIDVGKAAGRALKNRIEDEVQSLLERLIKKRPPD